MGDNQAKKLVIFGTGDFAELMVHYFREETDYQISGFTMDRQFIKDSTFMHLPLVPFEDVDKHFAPQSHDMFIAVGYTSVNAVRAEKYAEACARGYRFANLICRSAIISDKAALGDNCVVLEGTIVQPYVTIGNGVLMWSGAHIGHHSTVENFCFIAPRAALSGNVTVGERSFIGINATIRDGLCVGHSNVIGAGVTLLENTKDKEVYKAVSPIQLGVESDRLRKL